MTININRLVQNVAQNRLDVSNEEILENISKAVHTQTEKIHKYLYAFNCIVKEMQANHMISIYDAGFIAPEKQYLTVGINGLVEGAEFLGIDISNNEAYRDYVNAIMKPIYELNKRDKTTEIMFNCEQVPRHLLSGHYKSLLIDLDFPMGQQGASVIAA